MRSVDLTIKLGAVVVAFLLAVMFYEAGKAGFEWVADEWVMAKARSVDMAGGV